MARTGNKFYFTYLLTYLEPATVWRGEAHQQQEQ